MKPLLRLVYRAIIRMHPSAFRAAFGEEMLWIFDEESHRGRTLHLLFDGIRSIVVQNARPRIHQTPAAGPYYREIDSSLPALRFTQAGVIILSCLFCLLNISLILSMLIQSSLCSMPKDKKTDSSQRIKIVWSVPTPGPQISSH